MPLSDAIHLLNERKKQFTTHAHARQREEVDNQFQLESFFVGGVVNETVRAERARIPPVDRAVVAQAFGVKYVPATESRQRAEIGLREKHVTQVTSVVFATY